MSIFCHAEGAAAASIGAESTVRAIAPERMKGTNRRTAFSYLSGLKDD
jgi:hypothetical protein